MFYSTKKTSLSSADPTDDLKDPSCMFKRLPTKFLNTVSKDKSSFDLFFCYNQPSCKAKVKALYDLLSRENLKIWLDIINARGKILEDEIVIGIKNSKCIIFFITRQFLDSDICKDEISLAFKLKKPVFLKRNRF